MFRIIVLLACALTVAAFAPSVRSYNRANGLKMGFETAEGAQKPLGFWDPLGLLKDANEERFNNLRFVELKHGRIAMLAVVGHLVQNYYRLPGLIDIDGLKFSDVPNGLTAFYGSPNSIPLLGVAQIVLSIGWWDLRGWKQVEGSTPGDFGIPYLKSIKTEEDKAIFRARELNNGRAAQMGILALAIHEALDGKPYVINDILGVPIPFN